MTRAIVVAFHKYTLFGDRYYEPILDFFVQNMKKYKDEYEKIYFVDSTWDIDIRKLEGLNAEIVKVDPSLRYYDAYKKVLPDMKEDLVLFMDNDMVVYNEGVIRGTFLKLEPSLNDADTYDVVSIYDTIGSYETDKLNGKNKMCPYWFATKKDTLMKYLDVDWSPDAMPYTETFGLLTEAMLNDGLKPYEWEEDKSNCLFDEQQDGVLKGKDLGYYHIRAGSTPAYLLATKFYGNAKTYWDYINNQPRNELLRQCAWYEYMLGDISPALLLMLVDMKISAEEFYLYFHKFKKYHGL